MTSTPRTGTWAAVDAAKAAMNDIFAAQVTQRHATGTAEFNELVAQLLAARATYEAAHSAANAR